MAFERIIREDKRFYNSFKIVTSSGWTHSGDGTLALATNLSSKVATVQLTGLPVGKKIKGFIVRAGLGATSGNATVLDADLRKVTGAAGGVTDASVGAITQLSKEADYLVLESDGKFGLSETIQEGYQYYVKITGTTANNAACDVALVGIEIILD